MFGLDSHRDSVEIRSRIGYLSDDVALYDRLTGSEVLTFLANLRGGVDWALVNELSERLQCTLNQPVRSLSRGNRQKIGLVQAFMHKPELIIMDEPSSGLDPLMQQEFYKLVKEVQNEGRTVFISSHILPEVERVCDRVGIIRSGELVTVEDVADLKGRAFHQLEFHLGGKVPIEEFVNLSGVKDITFKNNVLQCTVEGKPDSLIKAVARFEVVKIISHDSSLEEVFLSYYGEGEANAT
jgi:ABC-2 type transport system ATP-binding protein